MVRTAEAENGVVPMNQRFGERASHKNDHNIETRTTAGNVVEHLCDS